MGKLFISCVKLCKLLNIFYSLDGHIACIISECEILQNFSALSKRIFLIAMLFSLIYTLVE